MDYDDPELLELLEHGHNFIKNGIFGAGILAAFPFLKSIFLEGYTTLKLGLRWDYNGVPR